MSNVYLITGASSDVGCALIRRLWQPGDVFIAQGAGDLGGLAELCKEHPGSIRTYDVDLTNEKALEAFIADVQANCPAPTHIGWSYFAPSAVSSPGPTPRSSARSSRSRSWRAKPT